jgi:hypothetical protein
MHSGAAPPLREGTCTWNASDAEASRIRADKLWNFVMATKKQELSVADKVFKLSLASRFLAFSHEFFNEEENLAMKKSASKMFGIRDDVVPVR